MVLLAIILNSKEVLGKAAPSLNIFFILSIEVLANNIRINKEIKGIVIDNREIKISLLADDMTLILQDLKSVENTIKTLKRFPQMLWTKNQHRKNKT